nr:DUF736 domain-containing protein [uncultured Allomuricauda sp.]
MKIGTFTKHKDNTFQGDIYTLGIGRFPILLEPNDSSNQNAPTHRVYVETDDTDRYEIGAAWEKTSKKDNVYVQLVLDCPSFPNPTYINLFEESVNFYTANWERPKPRTE